VTISLVFTPDARPLKVISAIPASLLLYGEILHLHKWDDLMIWY
jgi:hypothetical protein